MEELLEQLTGFARGMWRFRWYGLIVAWVVAVAGTIVVWRLPDRYEASARIYVDTQSILRPLMSGLAVQPNVDQQLQMLSRTLISRPNVEKLIHMANLDLKDAPIAQQEALIEQLTNKLSIKAVGRDNFYQLSYLDSNPEKARRVIQSLVSIFVESSLGASRKDTNSAKLFLDEQIKAYRSKLEEAETRLKEFRLRNIEMQAGGKDSALRLGELSNQLEQAKLALREAETARDAARAQLVGGQSQAKGAAVASSSASDSSLSVSTPEIDGRIEAQRRHLDGLLQRFTDQHPEVQATRRLLQELEEQKQREVAELKRSASNGSVANTAGNASPAYQELSKMLAAAEVQVATLRARVDEYSARYAAAREQMKNAPALEAEAAQLNRDYDIHKKNYEGLVARRESATMSGQLEDAGVAEFRLVDPPRVPSKPTSPNRMLLLPVVLVAALVLGVLTTFGMSQLRPVFYQGGDLRKKLGLPLLGVVTLVMSPAQRRQERLDRMRFLGALGSLVGLLLIVMAITAIKSPK
ncbi:XrtA system polysaccharide chain length determinant [Azohydromonas caseinilytica]|uniref:Chain length-determining protein n=1 Tax=Azohydromonas caseinilytica TaxID=2728836 RepID=A0A848F6R8_9BURK|nr:XrtA system polysaccharide chain length determinant [Azohydromonas caseinilytica]NML14395.1 chain length-determining protein [Azohydromonas caseinilytica]